MPASLRFPNNTTVLQSIKNWIIQDIAIKVFSLAFCVYGEFPQNVKYSEDPHAEQIAEREIIVFPPPLPPAITRILQAEVCLIHVSANLWNKEGEWRSP